MEGSTFHKIWSVEFLGIWASPQVVIVLHANAVVPKDADSLP